MLHYMLIIKTYNYSRNDRFMNNALCKVDFTYKMSLVLSDILCVCLYLCMKEKEKEGEREYTLRMSAKFLVSKCFHYLDMAK